ncbi:MAG: hypothetical protein KUA35_13675 [Pseudodesulfovibrio sp.]|uniref:hypothetical protein n=1 Tax=Pseudodesulfovibrio TaxID=2035811 RepID=UPI0012FF122C|nr:MULTISPECIES: hypothetical protein [Pseudodesulfovibrio]MBU4192564.1 hypothetical protein [Pseudomonadota bacterium]MBU4243119.1 hypothetical protein [Pseudomonadota bacterium]MBU4378635.1 hypothetical protein [Pseudomonadota bacterium]MBU4474612.1 hypothetical protein [Pseudomonadota bacterium]MBU4514915.1 hypothetical protein [Pseudomonadota bacterium]
MYYAVIGFDSNAWFKQETAEIEYQGCQLQIVREKMEEREDGRNPIPISNQLIIPTSGDAEYRSHEIGLVFLSELSWLYGISIYSVEHGGGTVPVRYLTKFAGHRGGRIVVDLN